MLGTRKGSKNSIDNRGAKTIKTCHVCKGVCKPFKLIENGKRKK